MIKREQWLQLTEVDITYLNAHALESQLLAELGVLFFSLSNKEIQQLADSFLSAAALSVVNQTFSIGPQYADALNTRGTIYYALNEYEN